MGREADTLRDQIAVIADAHGQIDIAWAEVKLALCRTGIGRDIASATTEIDAQLDRINNITLAYCDVDGRDIEAHEPPTLAEIPGMPGQIDVDALFESLASVDLKGDNLGSDARIG